MNTITLLMAIAGLSLPLTAQTGGWTFEDDFESGAINYGEWTRAGRDLSGTGIVDVVSRGGSLAGHVYHRSFTETILTKSFEITPGLTLDFDMEVRAADSGSPGWNYNSFAGVWIEVSGPAEYGRLEVIYCTSGYRQSTYNADPKVEVLQIPQNIWQHHNYDLASIYSLLPGVNPAAVTTLSVSFWSYCSWWNNGGSGDVWFDNIELRNLASTLAVSPTSPTAGAYATFAADGFTPGARAYLAFSTQGLGATPAPPLGLTLDIASARQAAPYAVVSAAGQAIWTLLMPASASGMTVWMQAAHQGRSTRVLEVGIL